MDKKTERLTKDVGGKISRRNFLKYGPGLALALLLKDSGSESEKILKPTGRILDFFNLDESFTEMVVPGNQAEAMEFMKKAFSMRFGNHGERVAMVGADVAHFLEPNKNTPVYQATSIEDAGEFGQVIFDQMGNMSLKISLSEEKIERFVAESPESVINMSFEFGTEVKYVLYGMKLKYPGELDKLGSKVTVGSEITYLDAAGKPISEAEYLAISNRAEEKELKLLDAKERQIIYIDGYAGEDTSTNLEKMARLAGKHKDKLFVVAGGNPTYSGGIKRPDITQARQKLEEEGQWQENIIVVGFVGRDSGYVGPASLGADIYVDARDLLSLGYPQASSFATPVISEVCRQIIEKGYNRVSEVKQKLGEMCVEKEFGLVLDLDKAKGYFK